MMASGVFEMGSLEERGLEYRGGNEERIFVSVRLRPLNVSEVYRNDVSDWECVHDDTIVYKNACLSSSERSMYPTVYTFDRVFGSDCTTREVYEKGARDVAISVLHGINSTVFAYGQTSSGKTYTMTGVTEYLLADICEHIRKNADREFVLKFSAIEIYNESVRDLLSVDTTPLRLLDDPERGTVVEKLTEEVIADWNHVMHLLSVSTAQRQIGETFLNEMSSRSHQIIRLTIESSSRDCTSTLAASVNLVDLAGSERASQSFSASTRLKEGCHINRSLLTLGTVIRKLGKGRGGHIPFRDSKLTRILQTSLGGNARTAIICTMSPARSHVEQSRNTLLFANCAKEVTTSAQVNVVMSDKALVKSLQKKLEKLEDELRSSKSTNLSANFTAFVKEREIQIEKLEAEIKDLVLQRDIAQSKVKDLIQILGDSSGFSEKVVFERSIGNRIAETETSFREDPCSSIVDTQATKVRYAHENPVSSPRMSPSSSNISESYSFNGWDEMEKQSDASSEDICKEVHCIETAVAEESEESCHGSPGVHERVAESQLLTPEKDHGSKQTILCETSAASGIENQELQRTPVSVSEDGDIHEVDRDSGIHGNLELTRSSKTSIVDSASSLFIIDGSENTSSYGLEREHRSFEREPIPLNFQSSATEDSPGSDLPVEVDGPNPKLWDVEDVISSTGDIKETTEVPAEQDPVIHVEDIVPTNNKNTKDVSLDPIQDEDGDYKAVSTWQVEFKALQQEIIQLWHACKVSLTHRTYFFLLFQGDSSDSAYLQVERRRMKFLKNKFSSGEKIIFNRKILTLASSERALQDERKMLSRRMKKKLCEQERETLFLKWGISLSSKHRRLQLAHCLWAEPNDMDHVLDSALLIAKLMDFVAPSAAMNKEMLGLDFSLSSSSTVCSFRRGGGLIISFP